MSADVLTFNQRRGVVSSRDRLQCLMLAQMNEERAGYCTAQQAALKAFLLMNAAMLRKVAGE